MIFTVAHVQSPMRVAFDAEAQALSVQYRNPHRASGGRLLQVQFSKAALQELLRALRDLEQRAGRPLEQLLQD